MSLRSFVRKISMNRDVNLVEVQEDEMKWKEERESLLVSRLNTPAEGEITELYPPRKTEGELGPPVPIPEMAAIRLTHLVKQKMQNGLFITEPDIQLFCQSFAKDQKHSFVNEVNTKAYEEAIAFGSTVDGKLSTKMLLFDWDAIPSFVDCIFIGILLPHNSDGKIRGENIFSSTGMLELLDLNDVDEDKWMRDNNSWPVWDYDSPVRIQLAEKDMFKGEPEFFSKNSIYSTYLCSKETGLTKAYLWGK